MIDLADVDGFKICIQDCVLLGFRLLMMNSKAPGENV